MSTSDPHPDRRAAPVPQMDDAHCLYVLGLLRDGRPVEAALADAARAHADSRPGLARVAAELALVSDAAGDAQPALRTSPGFTDRVLAERRRRAAAPRGPGVVQLGLRTAAAAALVLALVLVHDARRPDEALANPSIENQHFDAEAFRGDPYARPDLDAGLRALLPGPLDTDASAPHVDAPRGADDPAPEEHDR